jgi:hypothetical protein
MHIFNLSSHDLAVAVSFIACIAGLALLWDYKHQDSDLDVTESILLRMSFSYWLVYCIAFATRKIVSPELELLLITLKLTAILSYFLTVSCILSVPLHRFSIHKIED